MINLDTREFEKLISDFIDAKDIRSLVNKFSKDRIFYYYVLKDISMGRKSLNYKILKKVARKKKVSENFIIEQAKSVLSYIAPYDEPELDNYYEVLNVSPDASNEIIREKWIELMKSHHPDKVGEEGVDRAKKINEAYEILSNPTKRVDYDTKYTPDIPIIVKDKGTDNTSRALLYLVPFILLIGASYLYLSSSGLLFQSELDKENFAKNVQNSNLSNVEFRNKEFDSNIGNLDTNDFGKQDRDLSSIGSTTESESIGDKESEEESRPVFVKIIQDDNYSEIDSPVEEIEINGGEFKQSTDVDTVFHSKLATPAVAVNDREFRNNELSSGIPVPPDENSLYEFVSQYVSAYKNRDLQTIRSLFAPNARENGVSLYKVLDTYKTNFSTLDIIRYDLKVKRSSIDNSAGIVMGDFIVTFENPKSKLIKSSRGSITWLLKWRGHKWEIEEINYKIYDTNVID